MSFKNKNHFFLKKKISYMKIACGREFVRTRDMGHDM